MAGADVLEVPARRLLPAGTRRLLLIVVVLLVVAVLGDQQLRRHETGQLLDAMSAAQATLQYADNRVAGTASYASPQLRSAQAPASVRADLRALVQSAAAGQVPALDAATARTSSVRIASWHTDQRRARQASVRLLRLQVARFRAGGQDIDALSRRPPEGERVRRLAADALRRAADTGQQSRVDALLGPG